MSAVAVAAPPRSSTLWRVRDRASFLALRRHGRRATRDGLSVTWLPPHDASEPPRVAFAVARRAGSAVTRNRIRRRMRAACVELRQREQLPGGTYLLAAGAPLATMGWPELVELVARTTEAARSR